MICVIRNGDYLSPDNPIFGLANSMFRIATGYSCAKRLGTNFVCKNLPGYEQRYKDNIFRNIVVDESFMPKNIYHEKSFEYSPIDFINDGDGLWGYWQSEKYFNDCEDEIKELFSPTLDIQKYIDERYGDLISDSTSIHVRRGDYLNHPNHHPVCSIDYYLSAIEKIGGHKFTIFSDDIKWCKEIFEGDAFTFIEGEHDYIDLWLMSQCKNNIIANSSFSWWGAWLNNNKDKKVIAPKLWFGNSLSHNISDLLPEQWIKI